VPHWIIRSLYTGRWWVACYIWYSEEGPGRAGFPLSSLLAVPNVRGHPSAANVDLPIAVLLCDGPLLCGFNVANKELMLFAVVSTLMAHCISSLADSSSSTSTTEIMRTHILDRPGVNVRQTLSQPSACEVIRDCRVLGCQSSSGRSTLLFSGTDSQISSSPTVQPATISFGARAFCAVAATVWNYPHPFSWYVFDI